MGESPGRLAMEKARECSGVPHGTSLFVHVRRCAWARNNPTGTHLQSELEAAVGESAGRLAMRGSAWRCVELAMCDPEFADAGQNSKPGRTFRLWTSKAAHRLRAWQGHSNKTKSRRGDHESSGQNGGKNCTCSVVWSKLLLPGCIADIKLGQSQEFLPTWLLAGAAAGFVSKQRGGRVPGMDRHLPCEGAIRRTRRIGQRQGKRS